jgi:zinc/manganese transport system permease protein
MSFLGQAFMQHALLAGTGIAIASGLVGYFVVLRSQVFTGDALSHVAFTGALAALALGIDARIGLFALTIAIGLLMGAFGRRGRADDAAIGSVFVWILGLGVLFLSIYTTTRSAGNGGRSVAVLFGSILGLSRGQAATAAAAAAAVALIVLGIARPLLFASVDEVTATSRGIPVRLLSLGFLGLVGATVALSTQAVGALLLLGLLSAPAGTAQRLTARPYLAMALSVAIAVLDVWVGLIISYFVSQVPASFGILAVATAGYLLVLAARPIGGAARARNRLAASSP